MPEEQLSRNTFKWLPEPEGGHHSKKYAPITAEEVAEQHGVPEEYLVKHLREEIDEEDSCTTLPFTLLMIFSYTLMLNLHDAITTVNAVEDAVTSDIAGNANFAFTSANGLVGHKAIDDVNSHTDFWSWILQGFVPLLFVQETPFSEGADLTDPRTIAATKSIAPEDRGYWMVFNRIVGGIRIRQERGWASDCSTMDSLLSFYAMPCVGDTDYDLYPELSTARSSTNTSLGFWLYMAQEKDIVLNTLRGLEVDMWLDRYTQKIEIAIPTYNAEYGIHSIVMVNFFFSRGGHIWKRIIPMSTYAQWFGNGMSYFIDMVWFLCLMFISFTEVKKIFQIVSSGGIKELKSTYVSFWTVVDWMSVGIGFGILGILFTRFSATSTINGLLEDIGEINATSDPDIDYRLLVAEYVDTLEAEVNEAYTCRTVLGCYPLLIVGRLFKSFSAQPRMSIVTKTISTAFVDLVHFLLVFISIFLTYVIAGIVLFGRELDGFTTVTRAVTTCFRCMMGDFDWDDLSKIGRFEAATWFLSFMVIIVMLMLNMLLAIVMDAYSEQKECIGDAETLWAEAGQSFTRWKGQRRGYLVNLRDVLKAVTSHQDHFQVVHRDYVEYDATLTADGQMGITTTTAAPSKDFTLISVAGLREVCPRMTTDQAVELLTEAVKAYYNDNKENADLEEMLHVIRRVNHITKKLKKKVKESISSTLESGEATRNINELISKSASPFMEDLHACREELKRAQEWISQEEMADAAALLAAERFSERTDVETNLNLDEPWSHPLRRLDEVSEWCVRQVLDDPQAVLDACHDAGMSNENDKLRKQAAGKPVRVLQLDPKDNTVKCRVPTVGDIWFAIGALTQLRPSAAQEVQKTGQMGSDEEDLDFQGDAVPFEQVQQRVNELEIELKMGRQTVSEALMAVSELEFRILREHEEKVKITTKFHLLKKKVLQLTRENRRLLEEVRRQDGKLEVVSKSREEFRDLMAAMKDENEKLRARLGRPGGMVLPVEGEPQTGRKGSGGGGGDDGRRGRR